MKDEDPDVLVTTEQKLRARLVAIEHIATHAESIAQQPAVVIGGYTDEDALKAIIRLARNALPDDRLEAR